MTFNLLEVRLLRFKCQYVFVIGAKMSFEQRANIKFCFKIGKTFTETFQLMKQVYGDDGASQHTSAGNAKEIITPYFMSNRIHRLVGILPR